MGMLVQMATLRIVKHFYKQQHIERHGKRQIQKQNINDNNNLVNIDTVMANKNGRECVFGQYLHEIFTKFKKERRFCNLLVLSFSKLTLILIFGQVEA